MLQVWARTYAERWGLSDAAVAELNEALITHTPQGTDDRAYTTAPPDGGVRFPPPSERYDDLGLIKLGGMGEVRRVWDIALHRSVALKALRKDLADREDLVLRFIEEAQATGQLEHPGIVPIYDIGTLPDGRPYFTMKEIRGRTMLDVIEELHAASSEGWRASPTGWTFPRLVGAFQAVCEAVAFAHARGVLHRDLKPTNVMLGEFGEVVVMDWGLAKIAGVPEVPGPVEAGAAAPVITTRSRENLYESVIGSIAGTPNYMAPEQARADARQVGPWSDVYALGAILYEILADRAPYTGMDHDAVVADLLRGPPPPPRPPFLREGQPAPEDGLRAICLKAMARAPGERYGDAQSLAEAIGGWLDQSSARERAIALVRRADALEPELLDLRKRAATLRAGASSLLAHLPSDAPAERKQQSWDLEDQAVELEQEFRRKQGRYVELLHAALEVVPDLPQAQARVKGIEELTGISLAPTSESGWLTLVTEPAGAEVEIRRLQAIGRRIVAVHDASLDTPRTTPIEGLAMPSGSYQLRLRAPGHAPLTVLARVDPGELWSTAPAGSTQPVPIRLATLGEDPVGTVRIPLGWSWFGGDIETADSLPRSRAWVDPFLILRHPVSNREFLAFLRELEQLKPRHAAAYAPGGWIARDGTLGRPEAEHPDAPVRRVTFDGAAAYATWLSQRTGRLWRLPREREWERAARGVDERLFPWGNHLEPRWACVGVSHQHQRPAPARLTAFPLDVSPWGVRGMGGNVRDWVVGDGARRSDTGEVPRGHRWVRGGHYLGVPQFARCALRYTIPTHADKTVGFRLVSPLTEGVAAGATDGARPPDEEPTLVSSI